MIDKFWYNWKSSLGLVDIAMWKKRSNTGWYVQIMLCHPMEFFWKVDGVLKFEKQIYDI